jgi:predicted RNase H-like HicB family nuclease
MSGRSTRSSSRKVAKSSAALDRPFDSKVLRQAKEIAARYRLILEPDDDIGFVGRALEMPTVFADGRTPNECIRATQEALTAAVATMLEAGDRPPAAASPARRQAQINIRVSAEEKLVLEETARRNGFRGVSDFVRTVALDRTKSS